MRLIVVHETWHIWRNKPIKEHVYLVLCHLKNGINRNCILVSMFYHQLLLPINLDPNHEGHIVYIEASCNMFFQHWR